MKRKKVYSLLVAGILLLVVFILVSLLAFPVRSSQAAGEALSGGGYVLTPLSWQEGSLASGGDYRLLMEASPGLAAGGCCCTYLPCVVR